MYDGGSPDTVVELGAVPRSSVGAPLPVIVAAERSLELAYYAEVPDPEWDGTYVRVVDRHAERPVVLVQFEAAYAWFHGPPNDEAFDGHPLASHGLRPYGSFRVDGSSWIRRLERMNSVHEHHDPSGFERLRHYATTSSPSHDSTFECVALSFTTQRLAGPLARVAVNMAKALGPA